MRRRLRTRRFLRVLIKLPKLTAHVEKRNDLAIMIHAGLAIMLAENQRNLSVGTKNDFSAEVQYRGENMALICPSLAML